MKSLNMSEIENKPNSYTVEFLHFLDPLNQAYQLLLFTTVLQSYSRGPNCFCIEADLYQM